jgi:uncharacterized protein
MSVFHPSGALWLPELETVLVADLHLGYGLAQRRRGQLGPIADTRTAEKLQTLLQELSPKTLILLGDSVHAPNPGELERKWIAERLQGWSRETSLVFVRGNHDRRIEADFQVETVEEWRGGGLICVHGDGPIPQPSAGEIVVMGHLHPAIGIDDASGVRQRMPVFLAGPQVLVLPAFSPFAAGLDVRRRFPPELRIFGGAANFIATAATGSRIVELGLVSRISSSAVGSRPSAFRQRG